MTIVAAWMSADTGVGPSMASMSQACNGTWADFPQAASSRRKPSRVAYPPDRVGALALTSAKFSVPSWARKVNIAMTMPRSPMRFMMKALLPAAAAFGFWNQKPMSR